ncbi:MAG: hypothetical protein ACQEWV_17125 [Bacillota bacterium]
MRKFIHITSLFVCFFLLYDHYNAYAEDNHETFTVTSDSAYIYEKRNGTLVVIGTLAKNQTFASDFKHTSWHKFKIAGKEMYIYKDDTKTLANAKITSHLNHTGREFTINKNVSVYDNSGKVLKPMAELLGGSSFTALKEYSSWISIQLSDRIGYIRKSEVSLGFASKDSYFKVMEDNVSVYQKTSNGLKEIGL